VPGASSARSAGRAICGRTGMARSGPAPGVTSSCRAVKAASWPRGPRPTWDGPRRQWDPGWPFAGSQRRQASGGPQPVLTRTPGCTLPCRTRPRSAATNAPRVEAPSDAAPRSTTSTLDTIDRCREPVTTQRVDPVGRRHDRHQSVKPRWPDGGCSPLNAPPQGRPRPPSPARRPDHAPAPPFAGWSAKPRPAPSLAPKPLWSGRRVNGRREASVAVSVAVHLRPALSTEVHTAR
jgi:hypothetical protein